MKYAGAAITFIAAIIGITWIAQGNDFLLYRFFAPKQEAVRRETFEQSKAYRQGATQELENMQFEYAKASPEQKAALASIILHRAADYDTAMMTPELRAFVAGLRAQAVGQ